MPIECRVRSEKAFSCYPQLPEILLARDALHFLHTQESLLSYARVNTIGFPYAEALFIFTQFDSVWELTQSLVTSHCIVRNSVLTENKLALSVCLNYCSEAINVTRKYGFNYKK